MDRIKGRVAITLGKVIGIALGIILLPLAVALVAVYTVIAFIKAVVTTMKASTTGA